MRMQSVAQNGPTCAIDCIFGGPGQQGHAGERGYDCFIYGRQLLLDTATLLLPNGRQLVGEFRSNLLQRLWINGSSSKD
ncbi:MAG: hypothetical protein WCQ77_13545 [Planctomycetota bacterium]